jgi:Tfp pilus assembly protein PilN
MEAVNLLPAEYAAKKRKRVGEELGGGRTLQFGGLVALAFALLLGALYIHERSIVHSKQKELADTQGRIAAVQPRVEALKQTQALLAARVAAVQSITSVRMNWDRALGDFARVIPTNSYLTSLQVTAPVPTTSASATPSTTDGSTATPTPTPTGASTLSINGVAPSTPGVALVMDRLALLPWLSGITLSSASRQDDGSNSFAITATVAVQQ